MVYLAFILFMLSKKTPKKQENYLALIQVEVIGLNRLEDLDHLPLRVAADLLRSHCKNQADYLCILDLMRRINSAAESA